MKAVGGLLLVLGVMGLTLALIFWLPTRINLIVMVFISIVCVVSIWGGGKMSLARVEAGKESAKKYEPTAQQAPVTQQRIACPKCGCQVVPGQRFCGACGSSLASYCPTCGAAITDPSKFCVSCGARLG
jgi:hypothetical protein